MFAHCRQLVIESADFVHLTTKEAKSLHHIYLLLIYKVLLTN